MRLTRMRMTLFRTVQLFKESLSTKLCCLSFYILYTFKSYIFTYVSDKQLSSRLFKVPDLLEAV